MCPKRFKQPIQFLKLMQELYFTGDVHHALPKALRKAVQHTHPDTYLVTKSQWRHDAVIDFNLTYDGASVAAITRTRARVLAALQRLLEPAYRSVRYFHVICDGSTHDAEFVKQFQRDYGVQACVIDLGVLHGPHTPSKIQDIKTEMTNSNGVIHIVDDPTPIRTTGIQSAARAILFALHYGSRFAGTLKTQDGAAAAARVSVHAESLSRAASQTRCHFMFIENDSKEYVLNM